MIQALNLEKRFGDLHAVRGVNFHIPPGQICGYLGANGAGKSTTVKMLTGLMRPSAGQAVVAGYNLATDPIPAKQRLGYVPETGAVYEGLTPVEYLRFVGRLYNIPDSTLDNQIEAMLHHWGLLDQAGERMVGFSKGMKQKVVITAALLHDPDAIFFDEPLNGVDANAALLLKGLMARLAAAGKAILYTSHILDVVERVCDRIIILQNGQILADGTLDQLRSRAGHGTLEAIFNSLTNTTNTELAADAMMQAIRAGAPRPVPSP